MDIPFALLIAGLIILIVVPVIAGIIALVHAILDSVRNHRMPHVLSIIFAAVAIVCAFLFLLGTFRYRATGGIEFMCFGTIVWSNLRLIFLGVGSVCAAIGFGSYIFLSFRPDSVSARSSKMREDDPKYAEHQKEIQRTVTMYRILTVAVCAILLVIIFTYIVLTTFVLPTHEITSYTSPSGDRTILVDNCTQIPVLAPDMVFYGGFVYLRTSPFFVRQLEEEENRSKFITEIDPEQIVWSEDSVMIPYGQTFLIFYYDDVFEE